jgi:putative ABC transport system permease protein
MGVIRLAKGREAQSMAASIRAALPNDVTVMTPDALAARENAATLKAAPIGTLFIAGVLAGILICAVNCYQLMFNQVSDQLPQYATLKAMGFSDRFLAHVILEQAGLLGLAGFVLGCALGAAADWVMSLATGLPVHVRAGQGLMIWLLTIGMCILAGWMARRRLALADPAGLY